MADEQAKTVTVKALKFHTSHGTMHVVDEIYDVEAEQVDNLVAQGIAARVAPPVPQPRKPSQPVEPITTAEFRPKATQ